MANGLLDLLGGAFGTTPPAYLEGLLGENAVEDLRKRSIGSGLVNALIGYAAAPKNQDLGLGRILASAAQSGIEGAQNVYKGATQDYLQTQQLAEMKRQQDQRALQQQAIEQAATQFPEYANAIRANPELLKEIVAAKIKPAESIFAKPNITDLTPESVAAYKQTGDITQLRAIPKEGSITNLQKLQQYRDMIAKTNPNDPRLRDVDNAIIKETQFAPVAPAASTTVNIADKTFDTEFAKGVGASVQNTYDKAAAAQSTLQKINQLRPILKAGVYSGPLSAAQTTVAQIASKLGTAGKDTQDTLNRTAEAMQGLAAFELDAAAAMRGQGAITENERMLIQRAAAGRLDQFTSPQVLTLLNALEKTSQFRIQAHNKNLTRLKGMPNVSQFADFYTLPNMPKEVNY